MDGATYDDGKGSRVKKVEVMVSEESWDGGKLVAQNVYEEERERETIDDEEDDGPVADEEDDEDEATRQSLDDDDDDFDYDDRVYAMMKAQGIYKADAVAQFTNAGAGVREVSIVVSELSW